MLFKLLISLLAIGTAAGAQEESPNLRGRELASTKKVCIYLGREFRFQTFEVPSGKCSIETGTELHHITNSTLPTCIANIDKFRFYISSSRVYPAEPGECDSDLMRDLSTNDLRTKKFCRLFKHASNEWYTTEAISAATNWMKLNEFEEGACTNKNTLGTIHMEHLKEVNSNKWDDLYEELSDLMFNFTYDQLVCLDMLLNTLLAVLQNSQYQLYRLQLDAEDALYDIWYGDYTSNRVVGTADEVRTCRGE